MSNSLWLHELQPARLPCPPLSPGVCSYSCPLSRWYYLTISCSAAPFSFCLQSFSASGSFLMNRLFISGGQSIRASALASVLPKNIQGWFPLGVTGLISLQSKGPSRVFSTSQFKSILPYLILKWPCIIILIVSLSQIKKHLTWDHLVSWEWTGDLNPKLPDLKPMLLSTR